MLKLRLNREKNGKRQAIRVGDVVITLLNNIEGVRLGFHSETRRTLIERGEFDEETQTFTNTKESR